MDVPGEPGAVFALLAILVIAGFMFLLSVAKGRWSDRRQTIAWVVFTALFFLICNAWVRSNAEIRAAPEVKGKTSLVDANQVGVHKPR
jgi:Na+-transporting methylmalonyl-CoA/oxaloacetate decarboxylase gamma subunit